MARKDILLSKAVAPESLKGKAFMIVRGNSVSPQNIPKGVVALDIEKAPDRQTILQMALVLRESGQEKQAKAMEREVHLYETNQIQ